MSGHRVLRKSLWRSAGSLGAALALAATVLTVAMPAAAVVPTDLGASITNDWVSGEGFTADSPIAIDVYDSAAVWKWSGFTPSDGAGSFFSEVGADLVPGGIVHVTDGSDTFTLDLLAVTLDLVDPDTDTLSGTAPPGATVDVGVGNESTGDGQQVTADGSGDWSAVFAPGFDVTWDMGGSAQVRDVDGFFTMAEQGTAQIQASPRDDWVNGYSFTPDASVVVEIFESLGGASLFTSGPVPTGARGDFQFDGHEHGQDLAAGTYIVVTGSEKQLELSNLRDVAVDPATNVVSGLADAGSEVWVDVHGSDAGRTVTADGSGAWSTDFDDPGDHGGTFDLEPGTEGYASECDADQDCTWIDWRVPNPRFSVLIVHHEVHGYDWDDGVPVTLTIDDPATGPGPDYTDTRTPGPAEWDPNEIFVWFNPFAADGFELLPGFEVALTDGTTTKTHTVTGLAVTGVDPASDEVTGTAAPGSDVQVGIHDEFGAWRHETAGGAGTWEADFSVPGDLPEEGDTYDIVLGTSGSVEQCDDDGDCTQVEWHVPNPQFRAGLTGDWLDGSDFAPDAQVTIDVFETPGAATPLFATTRDTDSEGSWWLAPHEHDLDFVPGMYVVVTGSEKQLELADLTFDTFDPAVNVVGGTAPPGTVVEVHGWRGEGDEFGAELTADAAGDWSLNTFLEFGFDLTYDTGVEAWVYDDDGDATVASPLVPRFTANLTRGAISGAEFTPHGQVVVEIFASPGGATLFVSDPIPTDRHGGFHLDWFDHEQNLAAGMHVVVTGSVKQLELVGLTFHTFDPATDEAAGTAPPGATVRLHGHDDVGDFEAETTADGAGDWSVDLLAEFGFDVTPEAQASAYVRDHDLDETLAEYLVLEGLPTFQAVITHDVVTGWNFTPGSTTTVEVYDAVGGAVVATVDSPNSPLGQFRVQAGQLGHDLVPGNYLAVTDTAAAKDLETVPVTYDAFDVATDTAGGTAQPGSMVRLGFFDFDLGFFGTEVEAVGGTWTVNAMTAGGFDLTERTLTDAGIEDADGDFTAARPAPVVDAGSGATVDEGATFTGAGSFFDPGFSDWWSASVDYGDPGDPGLVALTLDEQQFALSHAYGDDSDHVVEVCLRGNGLAAAEGCDQLVVTVNNVAPAVSAGADATVDEGGTFTQAGSFTDPGADTWTAGVHYGDGGGVEALALAGKAFTLSHTYADGSVHTVEVCVSDDDGGSDCDQVVVTVNNVAPAVSAGPDATVDAGDAFTQAGSFTDPGADTWTATVAYGDGGVQPLALTGKGFTLSHVYTTPGAYTAEVCVSDDDGGTDCDQLVVTVLQVLGETLEAPTVGLVDGASGRWHLRDAAGQVTSFFYGNPGDVPFMGDWDCDGVDTPGLFRQSDAFAYLRNTNSQGIADIRFFFGNPSDVPLAGDFNGDGCDTLSIYRPLEQRFYVINRLGENEGGLGAADFSFLFGNPGDKPVVGDWDDDGIDEVGLHRESTGFFYWRNTLDTGVADGEIFFGDPGDRFASGDWGTVDGADTPAVFRPANTTFYFRHTLSQGVADSQFVFGQSGWLPVAGHFGLS